MNLYNRIARKLGLEDMGPVQFGPKLCKKYRTSLRLGKQKATEKLAEKIFSYCPVCQERVELVYEKRFPVNPIKFNRHND